MSQQPETPKTPHADPKLCKMGCGFFGNNATGDCCSKCWARIQPKKDDATKATEEKQPSVSAKEQSDKLILNPSEAAVPSVAPAAMVSAEHPVNESKTKDSPPEEETAAASPAKKKKKKKTSYKSMMAGMMKESEKRDVEKEKEKLRDGMGGGHFKKIDQI